MNETHYKAEWAGKIFHSGFTKHLLHFIFMLISLLDWVDGASLSLCEISGTFYCIGSQSIRNIIAVLNDPNGIIILSVYNI